MKITDPFMHTDRASKVKNIKTPEDPEKLMGVCKEFESIFLNMMLKQMRETVADGGLVEKSFARDMYESMQDEEMSKEITRGTGVGLAQELYKQLSGRQLKIENEK